MKAIHHLNNLEEQRKALWQKLATASDAELNTAPAPGAWSVAQVLYHLKASEAASMSYLRKKSLAPIEDLRKTGLAGRIRSYLLTRGLQSKKKYKAPEVAANIPDFVDGREIMREFEKHRENMVAFVGKLPEKIETRGVLRHPRVGMLNLRQTLKFFFDHFERHTGQIERTLLAVRQTKH